MYACMHYLELERSQFHITFRLISVWNLPPLGYIHFLSLSIHNQFFDFPRPPSSSTAYIKNYSSWAEPLPWTPFLTELSGEDRFYFTLSYIINVVFETKLKINIFVWDKSILKRVYFIFVIQVWPCWYPIFWLPRKSGKIVRSEYSLVEK